MKTKYKYICFEQLEKREKTNIYICLNNKSRNSLGLIKWYGPWRQYCIFPSVNSVFNRECNNDINNFITQLMDERKKAHCKLGRLRWYDYAIWLSLWGLLGLTVAVRNWLQGGCCH